MDTNTRSKKSTRLAQKKAAVAAVQKRLKNVSRKQISNPENVWKRIMEKVEKKNVSRRGCWEYTGSLNSRGYPLLFTALEGEPPRAHLAHRLALAIATDGLMPDGRIVMACHVVCDNPKCVNPKHLAWGDAEFNNLDKILKGRHLDDQGRVKGAATRTHCRAGHKYTKKTTGMDSRGHRKCLICANNR